MYWTAPSTKVWPVASQLALRPKPNVSFGASTANAGVSASPVATVLKASHATANGAAARATTAGARPSRARAARTVSQTPTGAPTRTASNGRWNARAPRHRPAAPNHQRDPVRIPRNTAPRKAAPRAPVGR